MEPKTSSVPLYSRRTKLASSASPSQTPYQVLSRIKVLLHLTFRPPSFTVIVIELSAFKLRLFALNRHFEMAPSRIQLFALVVLGAVALPGFKHCTKPTK